MCIHMETKTKNHTYMNLLTHTISSYKYIQTHTRVQTISEVYANVAVWPTLFSAMNVNDKKLRVLFTLWCSICLIKDQTLRNKDLVKCTYRRAIYVLEVDSVDIQTLWWSLFESKKTTVRRECVKDVSWVHPSLISFLQIFSISTNKK